MKIIITESQFKKVIKTTLNESTKEKIYLGYHSSKNDLADGYYKGDSLNSSTYSDVIRNIYMEIISDYDKNLENDDFDKMNKVFARKKLGFTFVSDEPIKASYYQSSEYKYGDYLYKVYGDGSEMLFDDVNEIGDTIVVTKKPLYFEKVL
jgi:hypothetical protein